MQEETGKVRADAALEAFYLLDAINFWCDRGPGFLADEIVTPHTCRCCRHRRAKIVHRPFPVAGIISPWNFPLILSLGDGIPALVAGCAVVIKPSEFTPLTLLELVRAWKEEIGGPGRPRRRQRAWARRAERSSTRATSSSSPAPSGPARSS